MHSGLHDKHNSQACNSKSALPTPTPVDITNAIGFIAGIMTTAANVPQVLKTYRSRSGEGLSFRMLLILMIGLGLWIAYGIMSKSPPIVITNGAALLLVIALIAMKFRFDRKPTTD
ncbi:MAG TPA: SemiSWEET transporter [Terriglobales bacterium]